ncbi:large proline-rich protein bag6-A isoform X1 [Tanacetum coccineum]
MFKLLQTLSRLIETMANSQGGKDVIDCGSSDGTSEATVEIKIKTLDSQTYTMRVDKCVPVPALKEQIATVTGVLSDQQRLICRGKVLKDDQLLSAYHVEDGHTLHLVVRQPNQPPIGSFPEHTANDPASSTRQSMGNHGPSVVVGTFNISEQGDGSLPDFSRIVSAVLGSLGISNAGSGGDAVDLQQHISERLSRVPGLNEIRNPSGQQPEDASERSQPNLQDGTFTLPSDVSMESLQVIPDSLSTLSQYLTRLRQQFSDTVRSQSPGAGVGGQESHAAPHSTTVQGGLPTPAALSEVTQSTRQLLIEQAGECLTQLTRQLGDQENVSDPVARSRMQTNALRSGALLQNLGAFLLELGRTTMTLRLGQSSTDAVVNAGPAVFISTSGPNPIMVQPLPFQPGTSFGAMPTGLGSSFPAGSGSRPRNIDIRIRTGSVLASTANPREASGREQSTTTDPAAASDHGVSNREAGIRNLSQPRGGPDVRVVPIRVSTLPPGLASSEPRRSSVSIVYPVLARAQHADSSNVNGSHSRSAESRPPEAPEIPGMAHGHSFTTEIPSGLDQLLRNLFPGEPNHGNDFIFHRPTTGTNAETAQTAVNSQEAATVSDQGTFLSNLLHQIMPVVSQHINGGADGSSSVEENQDRGASSSRPDGLSSPPSPKRRKTE